MKKYYSVFQLILILVLLSTTIYSFVEYTNESEANAKLQLVEVKVKEKHCGVKAVIRKRKGRNSQSSILVIYKNKEYWVHHFSCQDCEQIEDRLELYYNAEQDDFQQTPSSNKSKLFFLIGLTFIALIPVNAINNKMDAKIKDGKKNKK